MGEQEANESGLRLERELEGSIETFRMFGVMRAQDLHATAFPLLHDPEYTATAKLWDFRAVDTVLTSEDAFVIGKVVAEAFAGRPSVAAYLARPGVQYMKLETYRRARVDARHPRRVFTDEEEARAWLSETFAPVDPAPLDSRPPRKRTPTSGE